nr:hypothetical protein [uncultured Methanoregula sp.]
MNPQGANEKTINRPPAFRRIKERHNLLLYLCLIVIAIISIFVSPAQAVGEPPDAQPDHPALFTPHGPGHVEDHDMTGRIVTATRLPGGMEIPEAAP